MKIAPMTDGSIPAKSIEQSGILSLIWSGGSMIKSMLNPWGIFGCDEEKKGEGEGEDGKEIPKEIPQPSPEEKGDKEIPQSPPEGKEIHESPKESPEIGVKIPRPGYREIVIFGRRGSGRATLGNRFIGRKGFSTHRGRISTSCSVLEGAMKIPNVTTKYYVVIMPDPVKGEVLNQAREARAMNVNPHLFLYVIDVTRPGPDEEDYEILTAMREVFGIALFKHLAFCFNKLDLIEDRYLVDECIFVYRKWWVNKLTKSWIYPHPVFTISAVEKCYDSMEALIDYLGKISQMRV